ncbi:SDR family oxidoreductase [Aeromicrobium fastidiosum]|uniref:SDR family NAD(P)-dependent oxidoreductase n=1 Tax=Aeromicrobium fastidiosum TaxID=52699 RepID=A0A641AQ85_9ACTN|nr:SDR family oxidoreductase [Aeromicrobium fastidiosum]KAA1380105.1 SDR family NAD(P)-dependent oxidoreductase [Aeromicrobium fastidiosum]MBP2389636.1 NAD(P)-dependent dehydrogenase (short-subunit alcohol dehydrogenase family) [Aeromicrobium fastidiosum]
MSQLRGARVEGSVVVVTGANRGIGLAFVREALSRGAAKVYAGVRDVDDVTDELRQTGAEIIALEVTSADDIAAAAAHCTDATVLVNNAGLHAQDRLVKATDPDAARREMEVNYFAPLALTRAFAPVIAANGGGSIVNVLSVAAIAPTAFMGGYSPAKAATLYLGGITRAELGPDHITCTSLIVGSVDTRMASHVDGKKEDPLDIAKAGLKAMERGEWTCDTDRMAVESRARLAMDPVRYETGLGKLLFMSDLSTKA